ncbi:MAG: hydrolase [Sphingobium sp.]
MKDAIHAWEIGNFLDDLPDTVEILSLDCFDTLIWRNVNRPNDVFHELFPDGRGAEIRVRAEQKTRRSMMLEPDRKEIFIDEIYRNLLSAQDEARLDDFISAEMEAEARHCFAFRPVVDLIIAAKQRGLKVIIVSDIYWREDRLRELIARTAGQDVLDLIDRVFCSCDYGCSKFEGLFTHVLEAMQTPPASIAHLGDNKLADHTAPLELGIHAVHFLQFDDRQATRLRLEAIASTLMERDARRTMPVLHPHRPQIALHHSDDPVEDFGYSVLGPIMHGFTHWLAAEADAFETETGKKPKLLFLLRDGYLLAKAFERACPERADQIKMISISRFTALASSFTDEQAVRDYLLSARFRFDGPQALGTREMVCNQLLFTAQETRKLSREDDGSAFLRRLFEPDNIARVQTRSRQFSEGLLAHLRLNGVEDGDAVMLVDLGSVGTIQNVLTGVLETEMNLTVSGRYFLLREEKLTGLDKKGLLDFRHYETDALFSIFQYIALMEEFCTIPQGSVLYYGKDGQPRRDNAEGDPTQNALRAKAQAACFAFVEQQDRGWRTAPASWNDESARRMAVGSLARLLFLPTEDEIAMIESFVHDVNLGSSDKVRLMDCDATGRNLRHHGAFHTMVVRERIFQPGELRRHGMAETLSLLLARRFGLDLKAADFQANGLKLPILLTAGDSHTQMDITAYPTNEGYYRALVPVGAGRFTAIVMIGQVCDWFQLEESSFRPVESYMSALPQNMARPAPAICDGMDQNAPGLYQCRQNSAFLMFTPPSVSDGEPHMLHLVFRPIVLRDAAAQPLRQVA